MEAAALSEDFSVDVFLNTTVVEFADDRLVGEVWRAVLA